MEETTTVNTTAINWKAAIIAGIVAGAIFMMLEMILVPLVGGGSPWGPPRMIAAIGMGKEVLPPPGDFALMPVMVAMVIHFVLSIIFAVILAFIIQRFSLGLAILIGAIFGLLLYFINFYGFTAVFPWFAMARNAVSIFSHIVFGAAAAWIYKAMAK
ncbi:MAG: hypothetical protein M3405_16140 [Acidobacteriota bacterium]|jgi:uncharacterized membrane protein YagU involved in acid resistance|nr:hypothetical protein [Acidobacteriota bacterium]